MPWLVVTRKQLHEDKTDATFVRFVVIRMKPQPPGMDSVPIDSRG